MVRKRTAVRIAGWLFLAIPAVFALIYGITVFLHLTADVLGFLVRVAEFIAAVGIPAAGCLVLSWFAYKLLLQPVIRRRRLDRLLEYRARRAAWRTEESPKT